MDNPENVILLILIALSFIVSVAKKLKRKDDDVQQSAPQQKNIPSQPPQPRSKEVLPPAAPKLEFHSSYRPIYHPEEVEVTVSAFSSERGNDSGKRSLLEEPVSDTRPVLNIQNADEIKHAIICSEILHRKYE
ncbi:MAG: hypothetical protein LBM08_15055 [Dysgonamonadaceae bacterium]|jgi:hypothetical protein|nr:hypothetical protein [Dysgonamonadaceae bacterium]